MKRKTAAQSERRRISEASENRQETAPGMVVRKLKAEIESGKLSPGEKLPPQAEMANEFGVGISSVREAVNTLEVMGLLEVLHGSGTYVAKERPLNRSILDQLEMDLNQSSPFELFELREILECRVTQMAATRADDASIQKIVDRCETLSKNANDNQKFIEADRKFHVEICRAVDQHATSVIIDLIHHLNHTHIKLAQTTLTSEYRSKAVETAKQITSHIISGNEMGAVRCMRSHLDIMKKALD